MTPPSCPICHDRHWPHFPSPAKHVKEQLFLLKQGRNEGIEHKAKAEKLERSTEGRTRSRSRHRPSTSDSSEKTRKSPTLRHRVQLGEHLDKLKRHYRSLEKESVDLTTAEALPLDRLFCCRYPSSSAASHWYTDCLTSLVSTGSCPASPIRHGACCTSCLAS